MKTIRHLDSRLKIAASFALLYAFFAGELLLTASHDDGSLLRTGVAAPLLAGLCLTVALAAWLGRDTQRALHDASQMAQRLADGDLRVRLDNPQRGEAGELMAALAALAQKLAGVVKEVRGGAEGITTGTGEIASGNMDLSARTSSRLPRSKRPRPRWKN